MSTNASTFFEHICINLLQNDLIVFIVLTFTDIQLYVWVKGLKNCIIHILNKL